MKSITLLFLICFGWGSAFSASWETPFEQGQETRSATYAEAIAFYQRLAEAYPEAKLWTYGRSDAGPPMEVLTLSNDPDLTPERARASGKPIVLINNGIHAGEPCGIDASLMLARDLLQQPEKKVWLSEVIVAIIPVYNIGGALNRGSYSRANQVGPDAYGFRGNARNYDLNRDFIKADTRNAQAFHQLFQAWYPHLLMDTHTTNGADYPAVLTYIANTESRSGAATRAYLQEELIPALSDHMATEEIPISPYVYFRGRDPKQGMQQFLSLPRYSSGYASLFHTMAFITEAHMLKPFRERVWATYHWLEGVIQFSAANGAAIVSAVRTDREATRTQQRFAVDWELDRTLVDSIWFSGYEAKFKPSEITRADRMYYDQEAPYQDSIAYFQTYHTAKKIEAPLAYVIPQSEYRILQRLRENGVELQELQEDTLLSLEVGYFQDLETSSRSYEGHFFHQQVRLDRQQQKVRLRKGDVVVRLNQERNAYIVHVLEPEARDSFFRWNYCDGFLMRKEYFSPYIFEEEAARMLQEDEELRAEFEQAKAQDSVLADQPYRQLDFLYRRSPHFEDTYNRYPIFFIRQAISLPLE